MGIAGIPGAIKAYFGTTPGPIFGSELELALICSICTLILGASIWAFLGEMRMRNRTSL